MPIPAADHPPALQVSQRELELLAHAADLPVNHAGSAACTAFQQGGDWRKAGEIADLLTKLGVKGRAQQLGHCPERAKVMAALAKQIATLEQDR